MKSNPIKRVLLGFALLSSMGLFAQQDVMISQYMFNNLFLNPAYAGLNDHFTSTLLHRSQWSHLEGAPRTSILGVDGSLSAGKMGLGMTLKHDQLGVTKDIEIGTQYAYHLRLNNTSRLSFGIKGAVSLYSAELTSLTTWDSGDPTFQNDIQNAAVSKIGFGIIWSSSRTYAGISIPSLYANDGSVSSQLAGQNGELFDQHYYLQAGHVMSVNENIALKPSVLIKYEQAAPMDVDINLNLLYKEFLWLGAGWRAGDAIVTMLEYQVLPELRIGYAYDMTTSLLNNYSSGSHEVMIGFDMAKEQVKLKNPRYF